MCIVEEVRVSVSTQRWKKLTLLILLSSFTVLGNIAIVIIVLLKAKEGILSLGGFVITIQALILTQLQLISCISNLGMMTPVFLFFDKFKSFLRGSICPIAEKKAAFNISRFQEIRFENVSFCYLDGRKALSNVNFTLRTGEKVAIVGENGAGKSTLIKLLLRFYDPTEGCIKIDGIDLKNVDVEIWRSLISGVFQDFGQYNFSVGENIALADLKASEANIFNAAYKGGFISVLDRLPKGLQTSLGKEFGGTTLSGGEWQKLAMSRAFLREASLLILDEPTSALDPHSEQEVFKKFAEQSEGKTTLLITHRLGSVKMADRILVFKEGALIEEGNHFYLLQKKGEYANLFNTQAKQYINA